MTTRQDKFVAQCKRRFGTQNPERMRVEHWEWMVRSREDPYAVRTKIGLAPNDHICNKDGACASPDPDWCFARMGMTRTPLPDGRIVCIGGEHEDFYDPDFCIYNDVIVLRPAPGDSDVTVDRGEVEIYGYPADVFPPTDFHSATLVGDTIYIIGGLGYGDVRKPGVTPVYALDTRNYHIAKVVTTGTLPGWVHDHSAEYDPARHAITIRGGSDGASTPHDESALSPSYCLCLKHLRWELLVETQVHRDFMLQPVNSPLANVKSFSLQAFRPASVPHSVRHTHTHVPESMPQMDFLCLVVQGVDIRLFSVLSFVSVNCKGDVSAALLEQLLKDLQQYLQSATGQTWAIQRARPGGGD